MELQIIQKKIYEIRGQRVMLDFDLAELYETETKYLKRAVRANINRFPSDFMFELSKIEWETLRCNFSTSNKSSSLRTQFATSKRGGTRYLPFAFTEQGVAMLASVLNSQKAIQVNIAIVRAFVFLRQYALSHKDLTDKLKELETKYNKQFKDVYEAINFLMNKPEPVKNDEWLKDRKLVGFKTKQK